MTETSRFFRYVVFGGLATVVDVGLLYALTELGGLWYFTSALLSYLAGMLTNFSLNKVYTFENTSEEKARQFGLFAAVALIGLGLNQLVLYGLVEWLGLWYLAAKLVAVGVVMFWSYLGHKTVTFGWLK